MNDFRSIVVGMCRTAMLFLVYATFSIHPARAFELIAVTPDKNIVVRPAKYDYVPAILVQGSRFDIWWCGALRAGAGDMVFHDVLTLDDIARGVERTNNPEMAFSNSGSPTKFDGRHTCDPSVIRVGGEYYMYYGGLSDNHIKEDLTVTTRLGVAVSSDGKRWLRANDGKPILEPRARRSDDANYYGLGQPSIVYMEGCFYLLYTDTIGPDGTGIYLIRSRDPLFRDGVEVWTPKGFVEAADDLRTNGKKIITGFSADWAYLPKLNVFMVALRKVPGIMQLVFFDKNLRSRLGSVDVHIDWTEGPGLARDNHGGLVTRDKPDGTWSFLLFRSFGDKKKPESWDIAVSEVTLR